MLPIGAITVECDKEMTIYHGIKVMKIPNTFDL